MSILTTFFNLIKPSKGDRYKVSDFDANFDIIDEEMHKPPLTVNGIAPDSTTRNISITEVPLAGNLSSDSAQLNISEFIQRASGGGMSIGDGDAYITSIRGNMVHTGYVAEELEMTVNHAERAEGVTPISATIDRDTFVSYVVASGTITLTYTTAWSSNPALYGITVTGTPIAGDEIVVVYVKEDRGTITTAQPVAFNSTGWNLFSLVAGYAKVIKYSTLYGFKIEGTYSIVEFSETPSGARTTVTLENGFFDIPSDGYVHVTGADATTCIYATWSDWLNGYQGDFESYSVDTIDLAEIMLNFPGGLCAIGNVQDEINFNTQTAIQRIQRLAYTAENLAAVIASGAQYDADTNYIYAVLSTPVVNSISGNGQYSVDDHGIEYFTGTTIPVHVNILYGENLKDKLRTDVLTISEQSLTAAQKLQARNNIGAFGENDVVNTLTSTATNKPLSAFQGKELNDFAKNLSKYNVESSEYSSIVGTLDSRLSVMKIGRLAIISGYVNIAEGTNKEIAMFQLRSGYEPQEEMTAFCWCNDNTCRNILVKANGDVLIHNENAPVGFIRIFSAYFIAEYSG